MINLYAFKNLNFFFSTYREKHNNLTDFFEQNKLIVKLRFAISIHFVIIQYPRALYFSIFHFFIFYFF